MNHEALPREVLGSRIRAAELLHEAVRKFSASYARAARHLGRDASPLAMSLLAPVLEMKATTRSAPGRRDATWRHRKIKQATNKKGI